MIDLRLGIAYNDGRTVTVTIPPAVQVAFERHYKVGIPSMADGLHLEHLYWLAWETLRKRGDAPGDFDVWLDGVASLTSEDAETDPTTPAV